MAVMLWQVPQQIFATACGAIYIMLKHRMQILLKESGHFYLSRQKGCQNNKRYTDVPCH